MAMGTKWKATVKVANCALLLVMGFLLVTNVLGQQDQDADDEKIPYSQLEDWASSFGTSLFETGRQATKFDAIQKKFETEGATVEEIDGFEMVKGMAGNIENMMQSKINAIKSIMDYAENLKLSPEYRYDPELIHTHNYMNAKNLDPKENEDNEGFTELNLEENKYFSDTPVDTEMSVVHVPTVVYDGDPKVANDIKWSKGLDKMFMFNYENDSSMSWQYFGSANGFMRQYPAEEWKGHGPDLFDARMRDWYIKAAASPKEIVIMLDTSGSMTGLRKEIAKHTVLTILETLSENDFVAIYKFANHPESLVPCYTNEDGSAQLVQATNENVRELQEAVKNVELLGISNFTDALPEAFEFMSDCKAEAVGANCNQAIMLVTDGVPKNHEAIFEEYNWPEKPVRFFTYLIGRDILDLAPANWMACNNRGYFTQVQTLGDVKEQVLKYLPVMARPMVLYRQEHPIAWTGMYADIEVTEFAEAEKKLLLIKLPKPFRQSEIFPDGNDAEVNPTYTMMTSVSIPVFDKENHTDPEKLNLKGNPEGPGLLDKVRIAQLLGVAGTDVPIKEIQKFASAYKLGVNGYAFATNNNGYLLFHPDIRPVFQMYLKPNYNSVDLAEVELVDQDMDEEDDDSFPRILLNEHDSFKEDAGTSQSKIRTDMINQVSGKNHLTVKQHYDEMKRAMVRTQDYFYHPIGDTPFSLGIALPRDQGKYQVEGEIDVSSANFSISNLFLGNSWRLHPDWVYCEYKFAGELDSENPEENMKQFFDKMQKPEWNPNGLPKQKCKDKQIFDPNCFKCDDELIKSLIFDAVVTSEFAPAPEEPEEDKEEEMMQADQPVVEEEAVENEDEDEEVEDEEVEAEDEEVEAEAEVEYEAEDENEDDNVDEFGIKLAFIATRSGLMRFTEHSDDVYDEPPFADVNNKAIEEVWYKRAVDYHIKDPKAFVYSVPFDIGKKKTKVTASHAIMIGEGDQKSPAAVAGMQIDYDEFRQMFFDQTMGNCGDEGELACYIVDNNGFVIISDDTADTGKFFGEVDGTILDSLIQHDIFETIQIYDFQAICLEPEDDGSSANFLLSPFKMIKTMFNYILAQSAWTIIRLEIHHLWNPDWTYAFPQGFEIEIESESNSEVEITDDNDDDDDNDGDDDNDAETYAYDPIVNEFSIKDGSEIPEAVKWKLNLDGKKALSVVSPRPCDKQVTLYELNEDRFNRDGNPDPIKGKLTNCHSSECERPFSVNMIPHTNLIMIIADKTCPCFSTKISIEPNKIEYAEDDETAYCKRMQTSIYRKKPTQCIDQHPQESEIKLCGGGSSMSASAIMLAIILFVQGWIVSHRSTS